MRKKLLFFSVILVVLVLSISGCNDINIPGNSSSDEFNTTSKNSSETILEDGKYSEVEDVAEYIDKYKKLPSNYITKKEAIGYGWESSKGNLWEVTDKFIIGGDYFGNYEGKLPSQNGRKWFECDVNYKGGFRGAERILYSNDGLIYYTDDHYKSFKQLY